VLLAAFALSLRTLLLGPARVGGEWLARRAACEEADLSLVKGIRNCGGGQLVDVRQEKPRIRVVPDRMLTVLVDVDRETHVNTGLLKPVSEAPDSTKEVDGDDIVPIGHVSATRYCRRST